MQGLYAAIDQALSPAEAAKAKEQFIDYQLKHNCFATSNVGMWQAARTMPRGGRSCPSPYSRLAKPLAHLIPVWVEMDRCI